MAIDISPILAILILLIVGRVVVSLIARLRQSLARGCVPALAACGVVVAARSGHEGARHLAGRPG